MSSGYGSKIYKNRKKSYFPVVMSSIVVLFIIILFFIAKGKKKIVIVEKDPPPNIAIKEKALLKGLDKKKEITFNGENKYDNTSTLPENKIDSDIITRDELLAIQNRAIFLIKKKQYKEAVDEYNVLLKNDKRFLTIIGICYYWMHDNEKALDLLRDAEDLGYFPYKTKKYLAFTYYELNELSESEKYAEDALKFGQDPELKELIRKLKKEENVMRNYKDLGMENFLIQFSREEHDQLRTIISDYLKEAYKEIGKKLDYFPNKQFVVILYNEKDFFDVTRAPGWAGGLYDGRIRLPVKGISGPDERLRKVIYHEYTHALISEITRECPLWINEGLAEYFSERDHVDNLKTIIPLHRIEKRFPSGDPRLVALAYRSSHDAVEFLIDKYGIYSVKELLESFGDGMDINSAFESVLYVSYKDFQSKWRKEK